MDPSSPDQTALFNARFNARYAYRVVMRQQRLWRKIDVFFSIVSGVSGTAAFVAIIREEPGLTLAIGLLLAVVQGLNQIVQPGTKAVWAQVAAKRYLAVMHNEGTHADLETLQRASGRATEADETGEIEWLRPLAYNDACEELGVAAEHLMPLSRTARWLGWLA